MAAFTADALGVWIYGITLRALYGQDFLLLVDSKISILF
jgi:hypothetical protein